MVNTKKGRPSIARLFANAFAVALLLFALRVQAQQSLQVLHGHVRPAVSSGQAALVGSLPRAQRMNLSIMLPLRNQAELNSLLSRLYDPASPDYHHFLSVEEFTAQFGPTAEDYKAVADFAQANGFAVSDAPANRMLVTISGTVDQVESAFHVSMEVYRHPTEDRTFYSPDREPALALSVPVWHIAGLDNYSLPHPPLSQAPAGQATPATGSGPGGSFLGSDMRAAYYGGTALTGAGQAVCTVEFGGYNPSDVAEYFNLIGQVDSVPVTNVLLDGQTLAPQQSTYGAEWANEGELDIEQLVGMAPGLSQIRMYIGNFDTHILGQIASDNLCKQIGASFVEGDNTSQDDPIFEEFAMQGQTVFAASGDWGAYPASEPAYPAEDVYVTGVGGTVLATTGPGGAWLSETGWSGSGGGISPDGISIPSWQSGIADSANQASTTLRNIPDVAMDGSGGDTYVIAFGLSAGSGGTSAAAQRWAGFMALVNQQAVAAGKAPLGMINPALYTLAEGPSYGSYFHDTTSGTNNCCTPGEGFNAVTGYDLVTGWGSPTGQSLINALAGAPATGFTLTNSTQTTGLTINLGSFGATTIKVNDQGGFAGSVSLAVTGLPIGVTASFSPSSTSTSSLLTLTASSGAPTGAAFVTVIGTSGALTSSITIPVTLYAPGFALSAPPVNTGSYVGYAGATTITVQDQGGFTGSVSLAASGVPSGVTAAFDPTTTTTTSNLSFTSTSAAVPGAYTVTVTGTSGTLTASTSVYLVVETPGFNLSDSPGTLTLGAGASGTSAITVSPYSGFSGSVTLSMSGLPSGMTASFSPNPTTAASVVTITNTSATPSTYTLTVNGVSGTITGSATLSVTTLAASVPVISNLKATAASANSEVISWTTDQPSTSQVFYGSGLTSGLNSTLVTSHSITLTNLTASTTYTYNVVSTNAIGGTTTSPNSIFTTPAGNPPQVGYVAFWGINNSGVTVSWSTDVAATTQLAYGTTQSLGQLSPLQTTLTASHGVVLTGLLSGTEYYFVAQSTGANGVTGYSTLFSFTTTGTAPSPPTISNIIVSGITNTSATITWTTDQPSSSLVNYGTTTGYGSSSTLDPTLVTSHTVTLTGLTLGTTYDFDVVSANSAAMSSTSPNSSFKTTSTTSPPVISNVATTNLTSTLVTVTWTTDQPSSSLVNYGTTTSYGSSSSLNTTLVTAHSVVLTGLTPGTAYDFDVVSVNAASQSSTSPNSTFTTPASNATPPQVGYVAYWGINNTGVTVSWSTDVPATAQLAYGTTPALGQLSPLQTALTASHGVVLTTLNPGTTYYFVAQSTGANGVTGYSSTYSFTTTGTQITPPPVISNVMATSAGNTSETITWTTDQATSSQVNYGLTTTYTLSSTLNSTLVTSHTVTLTGLTPGTMYDFDVMSANSSAVSSTSANSTFTTTGTAPAPVISNVSSSSVTSGTATITWTTDQAATSVVNYGTTTGYGSTASSAGLVTAHSVTLTGLAPNTTYDFDVVSANAANKSSTSGNYTFKTTSNTAPPPVVSHVAFWGITSSGVTISWSTNEPATTAVAYGTTNAFGQLSPVQTALTDSHGVTLTGLTGGTTYYFQAQSADGSGNTGTSTTYSFTTLPGPPAISGVTVTPAANHTATISWTTSVPAYSYVQYGASAGNYGGYSAQTALTVTPDCTLSYVSSGTIHYQLVSTDADGNQTVSPDMTFVEP